MDAPPHSNLRMLRCEVIYVSITYKVQASKPSGYRFGLSRNLSVFSTSINQYITLSYILGFNNNILYNTLVVFV